MKRTVYIIALVVTVVAAVTLTAYSQDSRSISRDDFVKAAESTVNGVVSVKSYATPQVQNRRSSFADPFFEYFFGSPRQQEQPQEQPRQRQLGLGSGVIISSDGYIVTNNHVIDQAERLEVTLNDNRNFTATIVGADPVTDLALIKIDAPDLHVIPMGDSEKLHVGEWVLAVGNPFGFTSSVTSGIVSAKARNISTATGTRGNGIESYIQTDAALNSGNSGGALVNLDGELVGINTAIYSQTGTYAGCSFAIPTSIVQKVINDLKTYGSVQRAILGISFVELSPELIGLEKLSSEPTAGIYIAEVQERSAAMEAGLAKGDIITAIDNHSTRSTAEMQEAVTHFSPGETATITYWRDGRKMQTTVVFRNTRGGTEVTHQTADNPLGAKLTAIDEDTARKLELRSGVEVTEIDGNGLLGSAGVKNGFIILAVNGQRVASTDDITAIYRAIESSTAMHDKALFLSGIYPSGKAAYYAVPLAN